MPLRFRELPELDVGHLCPELYEQRRVRCRLDLPNRNVSRRGGDFVSDGGNHRRLQYGRRVQSSSFLRRRRRSRPMRLHASDVRTHHGVLWRSGRRLRRGPSVPVCFRLDVCLRRGRRRGCVYSKCGRRRVGPPFTGFDAVWVRSRSLLPRRPRCSRRASSSIPQSTQTPDRRAGPR
jgi:hypothetical protein